MNQGEKMTQKEQHRLPYVWAEIDLQTIQNNFRIIQKTIAPATVAAVLKANAYGLGSRSIGKALFEVGCRHFFVAYLDEADVLADALAELELNPLQRLMRNTLTCSFWMDRSLEEWMAGQKTQRRFVTFQC